MEERQQALPAVASAMIQKAWNILEFPTACRTCARLAYSHIRHVFANSNFDFQILRRSSNPFRACGIFSFSSSGPPASLSPASLGSDSATLTWLELALHVDTPSTHGREKRTHDSMPNRVNFHAGACLSMSPISGSGKRRTPAMPLSC